MPATNGASPGGDQIHPRQRLCPRERWRALLRRRGQIGSKQQQHRLNASDCPHRTPTGLDHPEPHHVGTGASAQFVRLNQAEFSGGSLTASSTIFDPAGGVLDGNALLCRTFVTPAATTVTIEDDSTLPLASIDWAIVNGPVASLTDFWQFTHFGLDNPDAAPALDPDGDGQDNTTEELTGHVPTDPTDLLTAIITASDTIELSKVIEGATYTLSRSVDLLTWTSTPVFDQAFTDPAPPASARVFYRVDIQD